ncbi:MAG: sugar ABC transporter permease [Spirochaetales bacterium]|nr:sugar ABC transporter permease [Spirochaetales bacterium]
MYKKKGVSTLIQPYIYLLPGLIIFSLFFIIPVFTTFIYGFTNYDGFQKNLNFVGFKNYIIILQDEVFFGSLKNNIKLIVLYNTVGLFISLSLAIILNNAVMKNVYRTIFFLPVIISTVAVGYMWTYMYDSNSGILNTILKSLNLEPVSWLGNFRIAFYSIVAVDIWKGQGNNMILLLAGLQTIPLELYESAKIDGANRFKELRYITLPLLKPMISMVTLLTTVGCIKAFDLVYVMTNGGPMNSTELIAMRVFKDAFGSGSTHYYGYASAEATVLFLITILISIVQLKMSKNEREE